MVLTPEMIEQANRECAEVEISSVSHHNLLSRNARHNNTTLDDWN